MSGDELAAVVAAATALVRRRRPAADEPAVPRWRLATRLALHDASQARFAAASASRWNADGRLRG